MDLTALYSPNPLLSSFPTSPFNASQDLAHRRVPTKRRPRIYLRRPTFRASASNWLNGSFWSSLTRSVRRGSEHFRSKIGENGFDPGVAAEKVGESVERVRKGVKKGGDGLTQFSSEFVNWNRWHHWKDLKNWGPKRIGALVVYTFLVVISFNGVYIAIRAPLIDCRRKELTEDYMEALVSDPSPDNIRRGTWRGRLNRWKEILRNEKFAEQLSSLNAKYVVGLDMKEVENRLRRGVVEKVRATPGTRALWISKRWWHYRPKLPYTYFLQKLDSSEVAAVVFSEELKRLYITMKEGFPLEYIVDVPRDPYLFEILASSGVEVDFLQKLQIHYFVKAVITLVPGILLLCLVSQAIMYKQFNDKAYSENLIMPVGAACETKSMSKEVVLGGDVWDLLDELMLHMKNPLEYSEREVPFVRSVLLSGPPGTGKTLFARTLSKNSGFPFVYASGAELTSGADGPAKINELFHTARRNAPSFVYIDEIDAIAGKHTRNNIKIKSALTALLDQLDGEKVKAAIDRFSVSQAVIFICATSIPEELDPEFVRAAHIDRHVKIGLPNEKQRVQIFSVHSAGVQLAEDVDFGRLVFRTVGYSGADIRNLVNEAAIMSVRKGHSKIHQEDIVDVLDKQLLEGMGIFLTEDEQHKLKASVPLEKKRLLAVHEAGHILLAHLFPQFDWLAFSQLMPGGKENAISVFYPREDMLDLPYTPIGYMKMQMVVAHGGRCAERVVFGDDITDGGTHDLIKITRIARELVISPQNNDKLIQYRWDDPDVIPSNMTPELSELFTREMTRYIEDTEELAMNGLRNNMHILDMIAEDLLEKSKITGLEVAEKLKGLSPIMFEDFVEPFRIDLEEDEPMPHRDKLQYGPLDIYPAPLHRC